MQATLKSPIVIRFFNESVRHVETLYLASSAGKRP